MAFITREDGEHFVIPSYRDVLTAKNKTALKKDILLLSQSYGEYITLQRKAPLQYEIAFSSETGYLLGESIWHYFKRPPDMIYCEAVPDTNEAILVIVKNGSVYLDGRFPMDSIPEELVIFLTQQNHFEIYIYGNVPISEGYEEGKFSFESSSVASFAVLEKPVFSTLPLLKIYQLQLVETVLQAHSIGVFPIKQVLAGVVILGLLWMMYSYMISKPEVVSQIITPTNPYVGYVESLTSPAPDQEVNQFVKKIQRLFTMPGWTPINLIYAQGAVTVLVKSGGSEVRILNLWAINNQASYEIKSDGIYIRMPITTTLRPTPTKIYSLKAVISRFIDLLGDVYPGNKLSLSSFQNKGSYQSTLLTITLDKVSPAVLALIGEQFQGLPFILKSMTVTVDNGSSISGSIIIEALGN